MNLEPHQSLLAPEENKFHGGAPGNGEAGAPDPRQTLAEVLYETLDRLSATPDGGVAWPDLSDWERALYRNCIDQLLERHEIVAALKLTNNDAIDRLPKEGEQS